MADQLDPHDHLETEPATLPQPGDAGSIAVRRAAVITAAVGIAHAVLLLAAFWLVRSKTPSADASDAELIAFYGDSENRRRLVVAGLYLIPFSGIAFLWFVVALRMWISGSTRRINILLANVQLAAGIVYVALIIAAGASFSLLAATYDLGDNSVSPVLEREFPRLGTLLFLTLAMRMAAMVVFTTSSIGRSTGILPRWFVAIGIAVGIALLLSASLNPLLVLVFPMWLIALSIILLLRAREIPKDAVLPPPAARDVRGSMLRRVATPDTDAPPH